MGDQFGGLQTIGAQGVASVHDVHDTVGQTHQRRQLHGTVKLDHFCLFALLGVVGLGHVDEFGGHAQASPRIRGILHRRYHQFATSDIQIQGFEHAVAAMLHEHILAGHTDIRRTVLHIGGHIGGANNDDFHIITGGIEDQLA